MRVTFTLLLLLLTVTSLARAETRVLVFHSIAGPNAPPNIDVDIIPTGGDIGTNIASDVRYGTGELSPSIRPLSYTFIAYGPPELGLPVAVAEEVVLEENQSYTAVAVGVLQDEEPEDATFRPGFLLATNIQNLVPANQARLRLMHAAATVPNVDVYINSVLIYENVGYGFVGSYLRADPNVVTKVDLRLAGASRKEIPYVSRHIFMPPAARWTLLVSGIARSFENPITLVISVEQEGNEVLSS
ncbi:hypothetical protein QOT17_020950 [Balamuthia mandrillaris]